MTISTIFDFAVKLVLCVLAADFIGFLLWALSGQTPVDGMYVGMITHYFITGIINLI